MFNFLLRDLNQSFQHPFESRERRVGVALGIVRHDSTLRFFAACRDRACRVPVVHLIGAGVSVLPVSPA